MAKSKSKSQESMTSVTLDLITLQIGQVIDYSIDNQIFKGRICEFRIVDPEGWKSPWMRLENVTSQDQSSDWVSCNNWKEFYDKGVFEKVPEAFMKTSQASEEDFHNFI